MKMTLTVFAPPAHQFHHIAHPVRKFSRIQGKPPAKPVNLREKMEKAENAGHYKCHKKVARPVRKFRRNHKGQVNLAKQEKEEKVAKVAKEARRVGSTEGYCQSRLPRQINVNQK